MCILLKFLDIPLEFMTTFNFEKINLIEAYSTINKFDVICLLESYHDSSIASNNDYLNIKGYNLYRSDHPNNVKRGGVCAYIRELLPVRCLSNAYLQKCLILEISINNKKVSIKRYQCIDSLVKRLMNLTPLLTSLEAYN